MTILELLQKIHHKELSIIVYDFETDGFYTTEARTRPIQFAAIELLPNGTKRHHNVYIKRENSEPLVSKITQLTGLTTEFINANGEDYESAMIKINALLTQPNTLVVGHNIIGFDNKFCKQGFNLLHFSKHINDEFVYDTGAQYKYHRGDFPLFEESIFEFHSRLISARIKGLKWNLDLAIEEYGLDKHIYRSEHNAMLDVTLTALLFMEQINALGGSYNIPYEATQLRFITSYYKLMDTFKSYGVDDKKHLFMQLLNESLFNIAPPKPKKDLFDTDGGTIPLGL